MKWRKSVRNVKKLMKKHMAWPNASPHACGAYESASWCSNASPNACGSEMLRSADQTRAQTRPRPPNACPDACPHASQLPELQRNACPCQDASQDACHSHQTRVHTRVHVKEWAFLLKSPVWQK